MLMYAGVAGPLYAFSLFLPSIINEVCPARLFRNVVCTELTSLVAVQLGYTATRANLLSVPVYAVACVFTVGVAYIADKHQQRGYLNMCASSSHSSSDQN